uniref:Structural maintenance of chromosomes 1B n=1 Tax=Callorhinchus milii TaxID=7868 RepID=A0A4W3JN74_CALMI
MGTLQLIEVEDFKSWRGRQSIGPFMRFTCIIGPNGSGKSNVMDAISFVMGERTANLRVKHLRDLIHGAHVGAPVSSVAKVSMVYQKENGNEVTFERIITGNSSAFHLNGRAISRMEYTSELEKIGILLKARNCLVFQGAVENIAMKKPKERTQLFEQISNSGELAAEYESKKKELTKAEEEARFNYNKKKSAAVERNHVKHEKQEADRYNMFIEDLKNTRIQLQLFHLYHNELFIEDLDNKLQEKNKIINSWKERQTAAEQHVKAMKKELGKLIREQQQIEKEINLNEKRPNYIKGKENTSHHIKKVEIAKKSLENSERQYSTHQQEVKELKLEIEDVNKAWDAFEQKVQKQIISRGHSMELEESQIQRYKELKELVRKQVSTMTQTLEKLRWEQKADRDKLELDQRNSKDLEQEEELTKYIESSKVRIGQVSEELNEVAKDLQNAKIDHREGRRQQKKAEIFESLKRMYPEHVYGRLVDLCHPIHKRYQLAATKIFGRYINAIVVSTEKVARDCIRYLKEGRAEPETFLPLDYLEIKPTNERLREIKGAKMMIDVVQSVSPQLKKVIQFVCGNALVCESMKEARQIAFEGPERLQTVALDGTHFTKSGLISGGSSDLRFKAKCWDEKEINQLKETTEKLRTELRDLMKVNRKEAELRQLQAQAKGTEIRMRYSLNDLEQTKKKRLANYTHSLYGGVAGSAIKMTSSKIVTCSFLWQVEDRVFENFCAEIGVANIREFENEHVKQQQDIDKKRSEFENQRTRLTIQLEYSQSRCKEDVKKMRSLQETIEKHDEELIAKLQKENISVETSIEQNKLERHNLLLACKVQDIQIDLLQGTLDEISEVGMNEGYNTAYDFLTFLQGFTSANEFAAEQNRLNKLLEEKENILRRTAAPNLRAFEKLHNLWDKFQESLDAFTASGKKARICRQDFDTIKKKRCDRFNQCFEYVSVKIDLIYKMMCRNTSAQAFLNAENPEEPYLDGIGYNCVAPGKRFMPMDNLSGGEKTVAALALLFAIHSFRPAPFFVLDEVDAALDNTNIGKVTDYIREQSRKNFQVIVISLKEEFYSKADALIGIYPEQGEFISSRLSTFDLTPYPENNKEDEMQKFKLEL